MAFSLRFVSGSRAGEVVRLDSPSIVIGRSRSCDIRIASSDVSGRHLTLNISDGGMELINLSAHVTKVNGKDVEQDQSRSLQIGDRVQIGEGDVFMVESDSAGATASGATQLPEEDETVLPPSGSSPTVEPAPSVPTKRPTVKPTGAEAEGGRMATDVGQTVVQDTVIADSDELNRIMAVEARKKTFRVGLKVLLSIAVFLCVAAAYYFFIRQVPETVLSWPRDEKGEFDRRRLLFDTPMGPGMVGVDVPGDPSLRTVKETNGTTVVETRIGKYRDVPCRFSFSCRADRANLLKDRQALFAAARARLEESGGWNFLALSPVTYFGPDNGIPAMEIQYLRSEKTASDDTQWFGILTFVCHGDCEIVQTREIPATEQWRGASFLVQNRPLLFVSALVTEHWEGSPHARRDAPADLLAEAEGLMAKDSPLLWREVEFLLRSALIATGGRGNAGEKALKALRALRARQSREYARLEVEWEKLSRLGDADACKRVIAEGLKIFSSPDDHRNELLRKGVWK